MPPQKTQIACPRCRKPIVAQIEQLFDISSDPGAKQRLLGGVSNYAVCQSCGYNGPLATPIVYHDADKELLLTYFPSELGMPVNEQEKMVGPLFNQITNRLPAIKRKGYLLRPQSFFTYQSLVERILGADGITPEMIQAQKKRVSLVERLLSVATPEARAEIIKQDAALFDGEFFAIFNRLMEGAAGSGQEEYIAQMEAIQKQLLTETEYGIKVSAQANEVQEAIKTLQAVGKNLDREKLLEILIAAPNIDRLNALVSMTRPGLDYTFFQSLTNRIDKSASDERRHLEGLREKLLEITRRFDQRTEEEFNRSKKLLETILAAEDIQQATASHIQEINDAFVQVLNQALQEANQKNDGQKMPKLQQIVGVLQKASAAPPEVALLEELLDAPDQAALVGLLETHSEEITPEFCSVLASILSRSEEQAEIEPQSDDAQTIEKLRTLYKEIIKFSMKKGMQ
jgi:hypothetical protein